MKIGTVNSNNMDYLHLTTHTANLQLPTVVPFAKIAEV